MAVDEWEYQDSQKDARAAADQAMRTAEAREQAQQYRTGLILYYETKLENLEDEIDGVNEEIESYANIMAENEEGTDAWNDAYDEYEEYEEDLYDLEEEELEAEEELEGLEEEQLWDDTAAIYDEYLFAEREYEMAIDRKYQAEQEYWEAEENLSWNEDNLW